MSGPNLQQSLIDHLGGTVGLRLARAAQLILLARLFGPERIGPFQAYILIVGLGQAFLPNPALTFLARKERILREDVASTLVVGLGLALVQGAIFAGVLFLDFGPGAAAPQDRSHLLLGVLTILASAPLSLEGVWDRRGDFRTPKTFELIAIVVGTAVAVLAMETEYALALGFGVTQVVRMALLLARVPGGVGFTPTREAVRLQLGFSLPLVLAGWSGYLATRGDDLAVAHYLGAEALAFYALAFNIPAILGEVVSLINRPLLPALQAAATAGELETRFGDFNDLVALLSVFGGVFLFCAGDVLLPPLVGREWEPAMIYLRVFALLFAIRAATGMGWWALAAFRERTGYMMRASWATAVMMVVVGWPLIAFKGLWGGVIYNGIQLVVMGPALRLPIIHGEFRRFSSLGRGFRILGLGLAVAAVGEALRRGIGPGPGGLLGVALLVAAWVPLSRDLWRRSSLVGPGPDVEPPAEEVR